MSTDFTIKQIQQASYTTSEQRTSESDVSVWNNPRATESTTTTDNNPQNTVEQEQGKDKKVSLEFITKQIEHIANELSANLKNFKLTTDDIFSTLSAFGYDIQKLCQLTKDEFNTLLDKDFMSLMEYIYADDKYVEERASRIQKLGNLQVPLKDIHTYICNNDGNNIVRIIRANADNLVLPDKIKEKLNNINSLSELTEEELAQCLNYIVASNVSNYQDDISLLSMLILLTASDKELKDGKTCDILYNALNKLFPEKDNPLFNAILERLSDSSEDLSIFLGNKKNIESIFSMFSKPEEVSKFLIEAQKKINSGKCENKQVLANQIGIYLKDMFQTVSQIKLIKVEKERSPEQRAILETYEKMKNLYAAASGHAFAIAEDNIAAELNNVTPDDIKPLAYEATHKTILSGAVENPLKAQERMNEITNNAYSEILTGLGYELITPENIETLMAKAAEGTLISDDGTPATSSSTGFGYEQSSNVNIDNAYATVDNLRSCIIGNTEEPTFTVDKKEDKRNTELATFNKANLSSYSGSELSDMIANGLMKFSDAVKQYSNHLSESGKRFVVQSIKIMDEGRQVFALNSTNNTARWEIMKKANLLGEDLKVDFDYNHELLRENYQA